MTGRAQHPPAAGHAPTARAHRAAGALSPWLQRRLHDLAVVLVTGTLAVGVFLAIMSVMVLVTSVAHAQTPAARTERPEAAGPEAEGPGTSLGGVTVTAPACRNAQDPAPTCAAQRLEQAAKAVAPTLAQPDPAQTVPGTSSPAAAIGLGTPAAAAQQPGTPYGKPPGYTPPPLPSAATSAAGPFTRTPR